MVQSIIDTIEKNTDYNTMPRENSSFRDFLYREHKNPTLDNAIEALNQYAARYNGGHIPDHLECVRVNGGAENIRNTWFAQRGSESQLLKTNGSHMQSTQVIRESNASHNVSASRAYNEPNVHSVPPPPLITTHHTPVVHENRTFHNSAVRQNEPNLTLTQSAPINTSTVNYNYHEQQRNLHVQQPQQPVFRQ